jgi:hypothetical protein
MNNVQKLVCPLLSIYTYINTFVDRMTVSFAPTLDI